MINRHNLIVLLLGTAFFAGLGWWNATYVMADTRNWGNALAIGWCAGLLYAMWREHWRDLFNTTQTQGEATE
jgi:hypothetical protein